MGEIILIFLYLYKIWILLLKIMDALASLLRW
jgi:hypothetical protein